MRPAAMPPMMRIGLCFALDEHPHVLKRHVHQQHIFALHVHDAFAGRIVIRRDINHVAGVQDDVAGIQVFPRHLRFACHSY